MTELSLRFFRLGGPVFLTGVYFVLPAGVALAQGPTQAATPSETFSMILEEERVQVHK